MRDKHWYLKSCPLLAEVPVARLEPLEAACRFRDFPKGSPIYLPADQAEAALLLVSGRVKLSTITPEGKEAIIAFIEPGEWFGELAVLSAAPRDELATAAARSQVVLIPANALWRLAEEFPLVSLELSRLFGLRRLKVERRLKSLLFRSSRERLEALLDELAGRYGRRTSEGLVVDHHLSHQDLAGLIGVTRETVTLLLAQMQREKRLQVLRRRFVLLGGGPGSAREQPPRSLADVLVPGWEKTS